MTKFIRSSSLTSFLRDSLYFEVDHVISISFCQLYHEITGLLSDFPELQDDFSSFLLPYQAIQCGVYMSHKEFTQARTFLSKIEVSY